MKRLNQIILLLGMMLLAVGCTLSLDEPVPDVGEDTLNGDGFSSPKTQLTEFGDVTYQFQDGVRVIDEKYIPYIVTCRNDTTLGHTEILFTKNIPGDLLPRRGELLATTMSQLFQSTLCDEVDAIEASQGGYLMTSHAVSLRKVFKELDFTIDASIAGVYENPDSTVSRSASGDGKQLKGFRLVPRYDPKSRADDSGSFSEYLFSMTMFVGDKDKIDEFEIDPVKYSKGKFKNQSDLLGLRNGGSATAYASRVGIASYQNVKLKFSLYNGFDLELSNDVVQVYSHYGLQADKWWAMGMAGSTGMTVPKDGILHENEWKMLQYLIPVPGGLPSLGIDVYVCKLCLDFNFGASYDEAIKIKGDKPFKYECAQKTELFNWSTKMSKDFENTVNRSKNMLVKDPEIKKQLTNTLFQSASRFFLHIDIGFTLGLATLDISPLRINLDASMTHKMDNDAGSSKPSVLLKPREPYEKEYTLSATDKSLDEWKGTLGVSVSSDMKGGAIVGDIAEETFDWFKGAAASLKWAEGSLVLWRIADSAFPVLDYKQTYNPANKTYHGTVSIPHAGQIGWFSTIDQEIKGFNGLELLIYDENFNFIKRAKAVDGGTTAERSYISLIYGRDYGFDFTLDNSEMPHSKYFYVVPAYHTHVNSVFEEPQRFFVKPLKYTNHSNSGQINGVETLWVENDDIICKTGYCLDGIAMDAECFFQASSPSDVHVTVEFFDSDGRSMMSKNFSYSIGSAKGGKIKAIYLLNHRIETVVDRAKLTLWYDDPYMQTSVDPSARKVILDEFEVVYDDNTEWWPVFDYADTSYWTQQGYRIGR